jgi:DNA helicase-2/ATP-dependent DNA helicase PcrA
MIAYQAASDDPGGRYRKAPMPQTSTTDLDVLLAGLNDPQREAVTFGEGPLLILAGAGSGKTRVLTHRIAYLLATGAAYPNEILAITFTNKAAGEMRERVELLVAGRIRTMWVMTFHAACARMLRANAERLGYTRSFTIYDQADSRRLIKRCLDDLGIDPKRFTPAGIQAQISDAKSKLVDADGYGQIVGSFFERTVAEVYRQYERELHRMNAMDFDDLLFRAVDVLTMFQEVRDRYTASFRHVLVDEYQDTNHAQYRWLKLLTSERRNVMVVGDDAQSVYSFRGADIRNILEFTDDYPDAHVVTLDQNYRSTQRILSAANAVIRNNRAQKPKHLWTELGEGDLIKIKELDDEHAEARFVVSEVERLLDEGNSPAEIAVFYRTNAQSRVLEDTLVRAQIPYQVVGGTKFYERAEIKDAIGYLVALVNPLDAGAFTRIVNSPKRGIGSTSVSRLLAFANTTGTSIWDVAAQPDAVPGLGPPAIKALRRFMATMASLRERTESGIETAALLDAVLRDTGYLETLEAERTFEAQGRIENLQELVNVAAEFDAARSVEGEERGLAEFLQQLQLLSDADERSDDRALLTLMTLHNAKGLEYPIVFMIGCEEGVFPHPRSLEEGGLEEERRLCYVGITRAQRDLYLTWARSRGVYGRRAYGMRSRFIAEIPAELTDQEEQPPRPRATSWSGRAGDWESGLERRSAGLDFRLGDDVVHPSFGDGVVTGMEPGGIVTIRFAADRTERKLLAELAPISKR